MGGLHIIMFQILILHSLVTSFHVEFWEAVYIIDGLLKNKSDIQPDTLHADTQGQSTPVFALAHLLGINLMPRIRNWKDFKILQG